MTRLGDDVAKAKLAASIQLTLPGTPFIYYGEEIGMTGTKPDERIRTPMQWDPLEGGGFTYETPWQPLAEDALFRTVFAQTWESDSLLSRYRALIRIRNAHPALSTGNVSWVDTGTAGVASYVRQLEGQTLWILHNLTDQSLQPVLAPGSAVGSGSHRAGDLLAGSTFEFTVHASGALGEGFPTLMPFETRILDLSGA